ncbi:MAG: O-antigen ligase family protein [Turicibacter sp.]|nr:O-antigen ligase family protein [Turicibacter sp.]
MLTLKGLKAPEIALFIVVAIVPIIVRHMAVPVPVEFLAIYQQEYMSDLFSYYKALLLCLCAAVIFLYFASDFIIGSTQFTPKAFITPIVIISLVYLFFVILSNLFSDYTHTALWGLYDRREGLFVQISYIVIFLSTFFLVRKNAELTRILLIGFLFSALIMGAIGFSQLINRDFFATELAAWLVVGANARINPIFTMAYGTSFNPNTFGLITAMITPLMFAAATAFKSRILQSLFVVAGILMLLGVVGSRSVGGIIGFSAAVFIVLITLLVRWIVKKDKKIQPRTLVILPITLVLIVAAIFGLRSYIYQDIFFTMGRISAIFEPPDLALPDFVFEGNTLTMSERGVTYTIVFPQSGGAPQVTAAGGNVIEPQVQSIDAEGVERLRFTYAIPEFGNIFIDYEEDLYVYRDIIMGVMPSGNIYLGYIWGNIFIDPNEPIPSWGFEGWETWGSGRGFIFSRTIPLLPQSIFIGSGSDTFVLRFPTHDIISNYRYFETPHSVVDKAHNLYLQTAITTGVISALALIALFAYCIITTFLALIRTDEYFYLRLGLLASVTAFSVSSLSTDSTVSSSPMFWVILGLCLGLNCWVENERTKNP